ncbi:hypothetical protein CEXT_742691 [Caerostris extrusa]|uniref:Uncharacterized protein n=1 Tax=Caerostris extrusa TaxID=172846 RepID=A0AAV4U8N8_CAEEX|nr:hypothetical protein CEXT_742691 [Caerostris extrusa]
MQQPPRDRVRDDIISLYQSKDMRDSKNFTSFMIHLSRIFHTLRKPEVLEISKDASTELKICLDRMFPKRCRTFKRTIVQSASQREPGPFRMEFFAKVGDGGS